jgi:hypothetical protein
MISKACYLHPTIWMFTCPFLWGTSVYEISTFLFLQIPRIAPFLSPSKTTLFLWYAWNEKMLWFLFLKVEGNMKLKRLLSFWSHEEREPAALSWSGADCGFLCYLAWTHGEQVGHVDFRATMPWLCDYSVIFSYKMRIIMSTLQCWYEK